MEEKKSKPKDVDERVRPVSKVVFGKEYSDLLDQKILNNKILWIVFLVLIGWNTMMQVSLLDLKSTNHVKAQFPPVNYVSGTQEVGQDFANKEHFTAWGMYHIITLAKFDETNIQEKLNKIANMMSAKMYKKKKLVIDSFVENVKTNKIDSNFKIPNDNWSSKVLEEKNEYGKEVTVVTATGDIFKKYGSSYEDPQKECIMSVSYFRKGGITYVEDFGTDCF